jgi:hypothetical protein
MTALVTFNSLTVSTKRVTRQTAEGVSNVTSFEIEFECVTTDYSEITALEALKGPIRKVKLLSSGRTKIINPLGTSASLVVNGTTYTHCSIETLTANEEYGSQFGVWPYTIAFVKDTTS